VPPLCGIQLGWGLADPVGLTPRRQFLQEECMLDIQPARPTQTASLVPVTVPSDPKDSKRTRLKECGQKGRTYTCEEGHTQHRVFYCGLLACPHCARKWAQDHIVSLCGALRGRSTRLTLFVFTRHCCCESEVREAVKSVEELASKMVGPFVARSTFVAGINPDGDVMIRILIAHNSDKHFKPGITGLSDKLLEVLVTQLFAPLIPKDPQIIEATLNIFPPRFRRFRSKKLSVCSNLYSTDNSSLEYQKRNPGGQILCEQCGKPMKAGPIVPASTLPAHRFPPHRAYLE